MSPRRCASSTKPSSSAPPRNCSRKSAATEKSAECRVQSDELRTARLSAFITLHSAFCTSDCMNLFELTRRLIDIPSVSGEEQEVGRFLASHLESLGYEVELQ